MSLHLTNVQMDRLLNGTGPLDADIAAHLSYCEECLAEARQMERLLGIASPRYPQGGSFRNDAVALATRHQSLLQQSLQRICRGSCSGAVPRWSLAAAMLVLFATLMAPAFWARHASESAASRAAAPAAKASATGSAASDSDDALLRSIDQEVATNVPAPLQPLQISSAVNSSASSNAASSTDERITR